MSHHICNPGCAQAFEHAGVGIHVVGSGSCHAFVRYPTVNTTYLTLIKGSETVMCTVNHKHH